MHAHLIEWLNLAIRWLHVTAGIAWIGASFYFNWLENSLNRKNQRAGITGSLWAIHGGGIYYLEKYKLSPPTLPPALHWFKWEAYVTWLSGFSLLIVIYYFNARAYLVDPAVTELTPATAIGISIASLIAGWYIYHLLCKSSLSERAPVFAVIVAACILVALSAYFYAQIFSARAAFLHVGALLGTCMAANVFFVIIPSQKELVNAIKAGLPPNEKLGANALRRSLHNNYMTLPVLFTMISGHYPVTFSQQHQWLILMGLVAVGTLVRHWFNLKGKGHYNVWILPMAACGMIALIFVTRPVQPQAPQQQTRGETPVTFAAAHMIVQQRCVSCHSAQPTDDVFTIAPLGMAFDTPDQIQRFSARIKQRAVLLKTMPLLNKTKMTDEERITLGRWIDQGSPVN